MTDEQRPPTNDETPSASSAPAAAGPDLEQRLNDHGVPTRGDLERLHAQIDALSAKLESLTGPEDGDTQSQ